MYPKTPFQGRQDNASFGKPLPMPLQFLEFDRSEDNEGLYCWDAVASPAPHHNHALLAEVQGVLARLHKALGPAGPLDEGHAWDVDLQIHGAQNQPLTADAAAVCAHRLTLSLCLSGSEALADLLADIAPG